MTSRSFGSLLVFLPLALTAQSLQERTVPLNNWSAPRQFRRSQVQRQQRVATPQFQLPGGASPDVLVFVPVTPCRLADTRPGSGYPALGSAPLASFTPVTLQIAGSCGVPVPSVLAGSGPEAYSLNVTVVPPGGTPGGYLVVYPNPATPIPVVASLSWNPGASYQTNAVIAAASSGTGVGGVSVVTLDSGSVNVAVRFPTDVVIDINGYYAAPSDSSSNTALGAEAFAFNTTGNDNTAFGFDAMDRNVRGSGNTAIGEGALSSNTDGSDNVALGYLAMSGSMGGSGNTAIGATTMAAVSGNYNIAIGNTAGQMVGTANYNIMIGSQGSFTDDHTIRIGDPQTSTYIAGISGITVTGGAAVFVNSNGQLGVETSSRRYKEDIEDMGDASERLLGLRPVTFHYKKPDYDGSKPLEYGLIAEEVAHVYPELVVRGADGQIDSVQYQKLPAMLLNELQKEHHHIQQQDEMIKKLEARLAVLEAQVTNATANVTPDKTLPASPGGR